MARYLREAVESYGYRFDCRSITTTYYHGLSSNMIFTSTIARFNHPTSTTTQITVAQTFATNNGIIIKLQRYAASSVPYFDCEWFSAFANESEALFIGGYEPLQITNIIHCSTGKQYTDHLKALNMFIKMLDAESIKGICFEDEMLIQSLINNEYKCNSP
eukprot:468447_1